MGSSSHVSGCRVEGESCAIREFYKSNSSLAFTTNYSALMLTSLFQIINSNVVESWSVIIAMVCVDVSCCYMRALFLDVSYQLPYSIAYWGGWAAEFRFYPKNLF